MAGILDRSTAVIRGLGADLADPKRSLLNRGGAAVAGGLALLPALGMDIGVPAVAGVKEYFHGLTGQPPQAATPPLPTPSPAVPAPVAVSAPSAVPPPVAAPVAAPSTTAASLLDVTRNVGGIPGVTRITNPAQPHAAPLFTNIADTGTAVRGIYAEPGISADSLNRTLATSSVFNAPADPLSEARHAAADRGDFRAVDRSYRTDEQQTAYELDQAHGAVARGITNSLRNGVPAKIFPEMMAGLGALDTANAKGVPTLGDQVAAENAAINREQLGVSRDRLKLEEATANAAAQTAAGNLTVNQDRLAQAQAAAVAEGQRRYMHDAARASTDANGVLDPKLLDQYLVNYPSPYGFGGGSATATPGSVDALTDSAMRAKGYSDAQIKQLRAARAGQ